MGDAKVQLFCQKEFADQFFLDFTDQFVKYAPSVTLTIFVYWLTIFDKVFCSAKLGVHCSFSFGDIFWSVIYMFWSVKYHQRCFLSWNFVFFIETLCFITIEDFINFAWVVFELIAIFPFFRSPIMQWPERALTKPKKVENRQKLPI